MSRKRQSEHNFLFYRAQFRGELPLITPAVQERAEFLKSVLESASKKRATLRGLRWRVGNLAIYPTKGQTLLYGRIGKLSYRLIEHYAQDELAFKIIELPEDHSVSFVFQSDYEYVAIEESSKVSAESAGKNLVRLFNSVPSHERKHYSLELPPIDDFETAFQKLKTLKSITRFRAVLRKPNPELEDVWREFYRNLDEGSGADCEIPLVSALDETTTPRSLMCQGRRKVALRGSIQQGSIPCAGNTPAFYRRGEAADPQRVRSSDDA